MLADLDIGGQTEQQFVKWEKPGDWTTTECMCQYAECMRLFSRHDSLYLSIWQIERRLPRTAKLGCTSEGDPGPNYISAIFDGL